MNRFLTAVAGGALALSVLSVQASEVEDAIEYRQGVFTALKWNLMPMGAMVKGEMPYDQAEFTMRAERLAALSPMALEGFVEGSDGGESEAKPEVWTEMDKFSAGFDTMHSSATALVEASRSGDLDKIRPAFGEVAKSCKGCHDNFRED